MSASKEHVESVDTTVGEDDASESDTPEALTRDDIFHILQCRRRRLVLKYLQEHDTPAKMTDITEHIAAVEHDTTVAALKSQERQRVYIALYQSHLPKLDEEGVIEYQQNRGIVKRTDRTDAFDKYLDEEPSMREDTPDESQTMDSPDHDHEASGQDRRHHYAGAIGLALALLVELYANFAATAVPAGVGVAIAAITVFAFVAVRTVGESDGRDDA